MLWRTICGCIFWWFLGTWYIYTFCNILVFPGKTLNKIFFGVVVKTAFYLHIIFTLHIGICIGNGFFCLCLNISFLVCSTIFFYLNILIELYNTSFIIKVIFVLCSYVVSKIFTQQTFLQVEYKSCDVSLSVWTIVKFWNSVGW